MRSPRRRTRSEARPDRRGRASSSRHRRAVGDPSRVRLDSVVILDADVDDEWPVVGADVRAVVMSGHGDAVADVAVVQRHTQKGAPRRPAIAGPGAAAVEVTRRASAAKWRSGPVHGGVLKSPQTTTRLPSRERAAAASVSSCRT